MTSVATSFDYVRDLVRRESAIVLEDGREYLVESRLLPLARKAGMASVDELVERLKKGLDVDLKRQTVEAMTTNETSFFRDSRYYEALKGTVIPDLLERRKVGRRLSIWSGASSSGQEVYSLCMLLSEVPSVVPPYQFDILATDICDKMIARVTDGEYSQLEVNRGMPAPLLMKYFKKDGRIWRVNDSLRKMVKSRQLNLSSHWIGIPRMDLVMMRNVLIYFDVPTKKRILGQVKKLLAPDGYLVLGGAETTINLDDSFARRDIGGSVFYQLKQGAY